MLRNVFKIFLANYNMKVRYSFNAGMRHIYTTTQICYFTPEQLKQVTSDLEKILERDPLSFEEDEPKRIYGELVPKKPDLKTLDGELAPLNERHIEVTLGDGFERRTYLLTDTFREPTTNNKPGKWIQRNKRFTVEQVEALYDSSAPKGDVLVQDLSA